MSHPLNKQYFSPVAKRFEPLDRDVAVSSVNTYFTAHPRNWSGHFQIEGSICPGLDDISCNIQGLLSYVSMKKLPGMWFSHVGRNQLLGWVDSGENQSQTYDTSWNSYLCFENRCSQNKLFPYFSYTPEV